MHLYDKIVYTREEYTALRKLNRECFLEDPEGYCENQIDFDPPYEISVSGTEYIMSKFCEGIGFLNKSFKLELPYFPSFDEMYKLNYKLPNKIDYGVCYSVLASHMRVQYVSHNIAFTYSSGDLGSKLVIHYPTQSQEFVEYAKSIIHNGYRENVRS